MKCYLEQEISVPLSRCDISGKMSVPDVFGACQDVATLHAEILGIGLDAIAARDLFWLTARTRIRFYNRPVMLQEYTLKTWPREPGTTRCDRFYRAEAKGQLLFEGRTEWCIWNVRERKAVDPHSVFDPQFEYESETVLAEPYARFKHNFSDSDCVMTYTVLPSDIDIGSHMNNVAYPRLLANSFPAPELAKMPLREMEILFMTPCLEGECLQVMRRETATGYEFGIRKSDGRYAALACMTLEK